MTNLRLEHRWSVTRQRELNQTPRQSRLEQRVLVLRPAASACTAHKHPDKRDDESGVDDLLLRPRLEGESGERLSVECVRAGEEEERSKKGDAGRFAEVVLREEKSSAVGSWYGIALKHLIRDVPSQQPADSRQAVLHNDTSCADSAFGPHNAEELVESALERQQLLDIGILRRKGDNQEKRLCEEDERQPRSERGTQRDAYRFG